MMDHRIVKATRRVALILVGEYDTFGVSFFPLFDLVEPGEKSRDKMKVLKASVASARNWTTQINDVIDPMERTLQFDFLTRSSKLQFEAIFLVSEI